MMRWMGVAIGMAAALALPGTGRAADADHGRALARQWCANCHAVAPGAKRTSDAVPSFAEIARRPDMSSERIRVWLQTPHPNMPNFDLSRQSVDDLAAYLRTMAK